MNESRTEYGSSELPEPLNPWAPPAAAPPRSRPRFHLLAGVEGVVVGLLLALLDIHSADTQNQAGIISFVPGVIQIEPIYFVAGVVLGFRHERRAWQAWLPLGFLLYWVHLVAIAHGFKQPYVERGPDEAIGCLVVLIPSGAGLFVGGIIRFALSGFGWFRRPG